MINSTNEGQLEKATEAFIQGAHHLAQHGVELQTIVNALIGAVISVCYAAHQPPEQLSSALRRAAGQVIFMYNRQDEIEKQRGGVN